MLHIKLLFFFFIYIYFGIKLVFLGLRRFSNLNVLHKGLLLQDLDFNPLKMLATSQIWPQGICEYRNNSFFHEIQFGVIQQLRGQEEGDGGQ